MTLDIDNPDMQALVVTVGLASHLVETDGTPAEWQALTDALVAEHTPAQLANMLTGAATLLARAGTS